MRKILWLTSWYPNKTDMFTGDFIQRHAKAAALFNQVIVLHVAKAEQPFFKENTFEEINTHGNLTEHIVYFRCDAKWKPFNKLTSLIKYFRLFRKLILIYLKDKNAPVLTHVHVPLKAGLLGLWVKRKHKIPYMLTEHYGIYNTVIDEPFEKRGLLFKHYTKKIIKEAAVFSPVSKNVGDAINKMLIAKSFSVVYNAVDTSLFYYQQNANEKFRFIHVSNMVPLKNAEGIIRSIAQLWAEHKNVELIIAGPYSSNIYKLAGDTGLLNKAIFFTGEISYAAVAKQMQQAQSLILFSKTENMPCVVLEALCCGLPVIATKVGGIPEVVNDLNGMLIESEDEVGLQDAMIAMMNEHNKFNREVISKSAKHQFSYQAIGKQIDDLYQLYFSCK